MVKKEERGLPPDILEPVIVTGAGYFQHNGLYHETLADIGKGTYCLLSGPEIDFDTWETWTESGLTWAEMIQAMVDRGAVYKIVE